MRFVKSFLKSIPFIGHYSAGRNLKNNPYFQAGEHLLNNPHYLDAQAKDSTELSKTPKKSEIINFILSKKNQETRYLEIGVRNPDDNYNKIIADEKYSVDPGLEYGGNPVDFKMTSDVFFESLSNSKILYSEIKFDIIFIDGLHLAEQVNRDIANSLKFLKREGFILLHDCNPPTEWHARESYYYDNTPAGGAWNGTTWKAFLKWRFNSSVHSCCIDSDYGVGIISKDHSIGSYIKEVNHFYEFKVLFENREDYLNLISFNDFKKLLL